MNSEQTNATPLDIVVAKDLVMIEMVEGLVL